MAEPMYEVMSDSSSQLDTPLSGASETSIQERERQAFSDIVVAFHLGFSALPAQVQETFIDYQRRGNNVDLKDRLDDFLRDRILDDFIAFSAEFRRAAADIFGNKYLYLRQLDEGTSTLPREGSQVYTGDEDNAQITLPWSQLPPFTGPFRPRPRPQDASDVTEAADEEMDIDDEEDRGALARRGRVAAASTTMTIDSSRSQADLRLRMPSPEEVEMTTENVPHQAVYDTSASEPVSREETEAEDSQMRDRSPQPLIPGFTINTRAHPSEPGASTHAPESLNVPGDRHGPRQLRDAYNERWLRDWIQQRGTSTANDINLHPYKGWKIEAPKIQLIRAKNFLSDEDTDRTVDWPRKFAELAEYFAYLLHSYQGEDWGYDLREAIDMLHTHWVFENYHYGRPKLNVHFPNVWPPHSKRLPPGPGPAIAFGAQDPSNAKVMGERKLLHKKVHRAHDPQYSMPSDVLQEHYIKELRFNTAEVWKPEQAGIVLPHPKRSQDPSVPVEDRTYNLVRAEDAAYNTCMNSGMDGTAEYLMGPGNLQFSPDHIVKGPDGNEQASLKSLKSFANFRGARRAALQQCLNRFDNFENRTVKTPWRALILPTPRIPDKPDAGIIFHTKWLENAPEKASQDPLAYNIEFQRFLRESDYWAQWVRQHAEKEALGHKRWLGRQEPHMDVPLNFLGPYHMDFLDSEMKKIRTLKKTLQSLLQRLQRAAKRAPRELLHEILALVDKGKVGVDWSTLNLSFRPRDYASYSQGLDAALGEYGACYRGEIVPDLLCLRPKEVEWLHFLGSDSISEKCLTASLEGTRTPLSLVFENRVREMMSDIDPQAFFSDNERKTFVSFVDALNFGAGGNVNVKKHQFTMKEAYLEAINCAELGLLKLERTVHNERRTNLGDVLVSRPSVDLHPEFRVVWTYDCDLEFDTTHLRLELQDFAETHDQGGAADDATSETSTISTRIDMPDAEAEFGSYADGMPVIESVRSWEACLTNVDNIEEGKSSVGNFFRCLGYRLGMTLRELSILDQHIDESLTPEQKKLNQDFVEEVLSYWKGDAMRRPNDNNINKALGDSLAIVTPTYREIIKNAEPEIFEEKWGRWHTDDNFVEETAEIVRQNVLKELNRNESPLFPRRGAKAAGDDNDDDVEKNMISRRDPVWLFAHPGRRGTVKRFWDINRWPMHLQSEQTQREIQASGPKQVEPVTAPPPSQAPRTSSSQEEPHSQQETRPQGAPRPPAPGVTIDVPHTQAEASSSATLGVHSTRQEAPQAEEEYTIPYWRRDLERRTFHPGVTEFWGGDTPLQRKAIEDHFRSGLETTKKETWRDRIAGVLFGKPKEKDPWALPEVDPRYIPKSKPRSPTPEEQGEIEDVEGSLLEEEPAEESDTASGYGNDMVMEEAPSPVTRAPPPTPANPTHHRETLSATPSAQPARLSRSPGGGRVEGGTIRGRPVALELEEVEGEELTDDDGSESFDFM